jgi:hypothetical protein
MEGIKTNNTLFSLLFILMPSSGPPVSLVFARILPDHIDRPKTVLSRPPHRIQDKRDERESGAQPDLVFDLPIETAYIYMLRSS